MMIKGGYMMDKTLEFTTKSPRQIKQGDTETMFTFICKNDGAVVDLTKATNIIAKIGNYSGYLRSQPIDITSLAGLKPGWLNLQPTPTLMAGLPAGSYQLEIWVIDQAGTSIYPSDKPLGFTITNNIENEGGTTITTITFDDFVEAMNKAASTIAKGDKGDPGEGLDIKGQVNSASALPATANEGDGYLVNDELYVYTSGAWKDCGTIKGPQGDTGTVDNAGLTTAPAFVALQKQVNNSAVGTNLIVQSDLKNGYLNRTDGSVAASSVVASSADFHSDNYIATNGRTVFTFSSPDYVFKGFVYHTLAMYDSNKNYLGYQPINSATQTLSYSNAAYIRFSINCVGEGGTAVKASDWLAAHRYKLEKGSVATDYSLNSADILTQADYAKIKAAIVALGGSLS